MATISEALAIAIQHHQAGRLQAAEQIYRQILAVEPHHAHAWHLLGVVAHQVGKHEVAVGHIARAIGLKDNEAAFHSNLGEAYRLLRRVPEAIACYRLALELKPDFADAHSNLGLALHEQKKLDDAVACYRRALELKPDFADAHNNLGNLLSEQRKLDEAVACYRRALELKPDYAEAHNNLGAAFLHQGKPGDAVACFRRALELKPEYVEALNNLGTVLKDLGKLDEAIACYHRVLALEPDYAEAHDNLGNALNDQGKPDEAVACFQRALELKPDYAEAHNNLGNALRDEGKLDQAAARYRRALQLKPDLVEAHNNLGLVLQDQGKIDDAAACFRRALELEPDYAEAHVNRALAWLRCGDWLLGWPEYEWRWRKKGFTPRRFSQPWWDGESLAGKTILLHAEQGLGDTIQFIRYAPVVKQHGATVIVECQKPLLGLLEGCPGVDQLVAQGDRLPAFDVYAPLLSVPGILKTSLETVPAKVPYLLPKPAMVESWRSRLAEFDGFKIGIAWRGSPTFRGDRFRSIPLRCFAPLAQVPGVRWMSLQKGAGTGQLAEIRDFFPVTDLGSRLDDFMDTAAVLMNLDLVIACDTAVAHLAGALGADVWVALPFAPDWRWLLDRSDSPWYPTMRLFRQKKLGEWAGVFEAIHEALCQRLSSSRADGAIL
jgi:tetratricopeptide (TPR) repeat protein